MDYDRVIAECPDLRRWQLGVAALLWLPTISAGLNIMAYTFAGFSPKHRCRLPCENDEVDSAWLAELVSSKDGCAVQEYIGTDTNGGCSADMFVANTSQACSSYVYETSVFSNTLVTKFDLVCGDTWKRGFIGMMYMIGLFIGAYILGYISDRYGRKPTIMLSLVMLALSGAAAGMMPSYITYVVCYVLAAIAGYGTYVAPFLLTLELVGTEDKTMMSMLVNFPFVIGEALMCLIAWATTDYVTMHLAAYLPLLALLPLWWLIPESPRWLLAKGRVEEAREAVRQGARLFRITLDESLLVNKMDEGTEVTKSLSETGGEEKEKEFVMEEETSEVTQLDLVKSWILLPRLLVTYVNWTVINLCYYGLTMNSVNLAGDVFMNSLLGVLIEAPAYLIVMCTMDRFGRKPILVLCQLVAGLACVGAGLSSSTLPVLLPYLSCLGKLGTSAAFALIYLYSAEMFPTAVRNRVLGTCSMVARMGSMAAPYVATLGSDTPVLPFLVFGVSTLMGGSTALLLPETLGSKLPVTRRDAECLGKSGEQKCCQGS